jgi:hypothetical protein
LWNLAFIFWAIDLILHADPWGGFMLKGFVRSNNLGIVSILAALIISIPVVLFAETDITSKIQLTKSVLGYDRTTKTSYLDVSIKNISQDVLITPIKVVINNITPTGVTLANSDGITSDLNQYFAYTISSNNLLPGGTIPSKRIKFNNPSQLRFTYSISVRGTVPELSGVVGTAGGTVQITDPGSALFKTKIEIPAGAQRWPRMFGQEMAFYK